MILWKNKARILFAMLIIPILGLSGHTGKSARASTPIERCTVRDCTCRVIPQRASGTRTISTTGYNSSSIMFAEDEHALDDEDKETIKDFLQQNPSSQISLIGYTDGCGTHSYNLGLASRRCNNARSFIRSETRGRSARVEVAGEKVEGHLPEARRVDLIAGTVTDIQVSLQSIPADVYLVDGSASMGNRHFQHWTDVISTSFSRNSRVYVSMMTGCRNGQTLNSVSPQNGTEIWYSYFWVIDRMRPGETLLIISDFQSNVPLHPYEARMIEQKVQEAGIKVYAITL
jgi:hypothetical protein